MDPSSGEVAATVEVLAVAVVVMALVATMIGVMEAMITGGTSLETAGKKFPDLQSCLVRWRLMSVRHSQDCVDMDGAGIWSGPSLVTVSLVMRRFACIIFNSIISLYRKYAPGTCCMF